MDRSSINTLIDPKAIRAYCDMIFGYLSGPVTIRLISEIGTPNQQPEVNFTTVDQIAELLTTIAPKAAQNCRAVFILPAALKTAGSAKTKDVLETGVIIADLDHGDIVAMRDHLARHLGHRHVRGAGHRCPDRRRLGRHARHDGPTKEGGG